MEQDGLKMGCDGLDWIGFLSRMSARSLARMALSSAASSIPSCGLEWIWMDWNGLAWIGIYDSELQDVLGLVRRKGISFYLQKAELG